MHALNFATHVCHTRSHIFYLIATYTPRTLQESMERNIVMILSIELHWNVGACEILFRVVEGINGRVSSVRSYDVMFSVPLIQCNVKNTYELKGWMCSKHPSHARLSTPRIQCIVTNRLHLKENTYGMQMSLSTATSSTAVVPAYCALLFCILHYAIWPEHRKQTFATTRAIGRRMIRCSRCAL